MYDLGISILFERLAKTLIRLRVCAGWSEPLLVAHTILLVPSDIKDEFPGTYYLTFRLL